MLLGSFQQTVKKYFVVADSLLCVIQIQFCFGFDVCWILYIWGDELSISGEINGSFI